MQTLTNSHDTSLLLAIVETQATIVEVQIESAFPN